MAIYSNSFGTYPYINSTEQLVNGIKNFSFKPSFSSSTNTNPIVFASSNQAPSSNFEIAPGAYEAASKINSVTNTVPTWWSNFGDTVSNWFNKINWDNISNGLQAIGAIGNAYMSGKQLDLARDQFNFSKQAWAKNWANSVKNYNTLLKDRIQARAYQETGDINAYNDRYEQNKL